MPNERPESNFIYFIIYLFIYLFIQKTTTITEIRKVPVHELDKKAYKLALTIVHNKLHLNFNYTV